MYTNTRCLPWQAVCTQIVAGGLKRYHPSMKWIRLHSTELRCISAVYIMWRCYLDLLPIFTKTGLRDKNSWWWHLHILNIYLCIFEICGHKMHISWLCCFATGVAMTTILCLTSWGGRLCYSSSMNLIGPPSTQLLQVNWIRYVTLWPWPLTRWRWSHVTWCHLGDQHLCHVWGGYELPFQS